MEESTKKTLLGEAIKTGALLGIISIILMMIFYIVDVTMLGGWQLILVSLIISFFIVIKFGKKYRNEETEEGFMAFGEAFKFSFSTFFISSIVVMVFTILLYEVIDPELPKIITDKAMSNAESMLEGLGMDSEAIDEALIQTEKNMEGQFTAMGILSGSWAYIISSAILGAIAAAFIKKKKPEFE